MAVRPLSAIATVICPGCGVAREVSARQSRRAGLCRRCLRPPQKMPVTDTERRFWLKRFSDSELAQIAVAMWGVAVAEETIHIRRLALLGSASQETSESV